MIHHINKMNNENHMIISIDLEKAFHKKPSPISDQTLNIVVIEGTYLNLIKAIYYKPTASMPASYSMCKKYKHSP